MTVAAALGRFNQAIAREARLTSLYRAIFCTARAALDRTVHASELCAQQYPHDQDAMLILRGAVAPTKMSAIQNILFADVMATLGPVSVGATLLARGLQLQFAGHTAISLPGL